MTPDERHAQILPAEFRDTLLQLAMLSHGTTQNWNPTGTTSHNTSPPTLGETPPHIHYHTKYLQATDPQAQRAIMDEAAHTLRTWKKRTAPTHVEETTEQLEARMIREGAGWTVDEVANHFHCTPTRVRRIRLTAGVSIDTGTSVDGEPVVDRDAEVRRLRNNGMSIGAIALTRGLSKSTVHKILRDAA